MLFHRLFLLWKVFKSTSISWPARLIPEVRSKLSPLVVRKRMHEPVVAPCFIPDILFSSGISQQRNIKVRWNFHCFPGKATETPARSISLNGWRISRKASWLAYSFKILAPFSIRTGNASDNGTTGRSFQIDVLPSAPPVPHVHLWRFMQKAVLQIYIPYRSEIVRTLKWNVAIRRHEQGTQQWHFISKMSLFRQWRYKPYQRKSGYFHDVVTKKYGQSADVWM